MDTAAAVLIGIALVAQTIAILYLLKLAASQSRMLIARSPVEAARADAIARTKQSDDRTNTVFNPAERV